MGLLVTVAAALAATAGAVWWLVRGRGGAGAAPVSQPPPIKVSPEHAAKHRQARAVVLEAFQLAGVSPTPAKVQYVQAVGYLETGYGRWPFGAVPNQNNWGAVQCPSGAPDSECTAAAQDSKASGAKYSVRFRAYPTPAAGAADLVRNVLAKRPRVAAALEASPPTVFGASFAMRRERYFEGFCKKAAKQYGDGVANASFREPDRDQGTRACQREAVEGHAGGIWQYVREIAASLGEPVAMALGSYEETEQAYRGGVA